METKEAIFERYCRNKAMVRTKAGEWYFPEGNARATGLKPGDNITITYSVKEEGKEFKRYFIKIEKKDTEALESTQGSKLRIIADMVLKSFEAWKEGKLEDKELLPTALELYKYALSIEELENLGKLYENEELQKLATTQKIPDKIIPEPVVSTAPMSKEDLKKLEEQYEGDPLL